MPLLLLDFDKTQLGETAQYVSNALNNKVQELLPIKSREALKSNKKNSEVLCESVLKTYMTMRLNSTQVPTNSENPDEYEENCDDQSDIDEDEK